MSKDLNISILLDFYGDVLSGPQKEALEYFYNDDLSLSEISELTGITRQGVRDRIVKGETILLGLEEKLGIARRFENVKNDVGFIIGRLGQIEAEYGADVSDIVQTAKKIIDS